MRTTIEMKPEHRARLLEIAGRRGEKGFSSLVAEALESYLRAEQAKAGLRKQALRAGGSLSAREAAAIRRRVEDIRTHWR